MNANALAIFNITFKSMHCGAIIASVNMNSSSGVSFLFQVKD